jgi:HAMP domain-containing protein
MAHGPGLPRPRISLQLYLAIALTLAVLCGLAGANIKFAAETIAAAHRVQAKGLQPIVRLGRAEALLKEMRRLVDTAAAAASAQAVEIAAAAYHVNRREFAELLRTVEHAPADALSRRFEVVTAQAEAVFAQALSSSSEGVIAASRYAASSDDLARRIAGERQARVNAAEAGLDQLAARAGLLIVWILAAAGVAGLLIGPLGLIMLRRVLQRIGAVGMALARLARNDTSVEIPDLVRADEIGEFARSVAVFKAKSIELLHKKAELERLNLQLDAAINNCRSVSACSTRRIACSYAMRAMRKCISCRAS